MDKEKKYKKKTLDRPSSFIFFFMVMLIIFASVKRFSVSRIELELELMVPFCIFFLINCISKKCKGLFKIGWIDIIAIILLNPKVF